MTRRLIAMTRPRVHHEALDWARRVAANGGSVSQPTLRAVSAFCDAIERAGIRDRFYRLNLFCGTGLEACLVPLFRSASFGGAVLGSATDTNNNFVSGDYTATVGLNANGTPGSSAKYLDTGLSPDGMPTLATGHASVFRGAGSVGAATCSLIGSRTATQFYHSRIIANSDFQSASWGHSTLTAGTTARTGAGLSLFTRTAANAMNGYHNTTSDLSDTGNRTPVANANAFVVFGHRLADGTVSAAQTWPYVISAYSIGAGMSAAQVASYHSALTTFLTALGRPTS